jgi:undecaprenyl-diphosphatase
MAVRTSPHATTSRDATASHTAAAVVPAPERVPHRAAQVRAALLASALVAAAVLFVWLMQTVAAGRTRDFDVAVLTWVEARRTPALTVIATNLTALGSSTLLAVLSALVFATLWTSGRRLGAVEAASASVIASILTRLIKVGLARERPLASGRLVAAAGFSFPSGHASGVAALLTAVALVSVEAAASRAQRVVLIAFYALLLLGVGGSRVYLGVHYPSDVVAGLSLGIASALVAHGLARTRAVLTWLRGVFRRVG